ncbi:MAG: hypothetical protein HY299_02745 [Verrucomicrobia bacterium]|nr:hypothetical protein [Verrucomicrobiota bacterium]
MNAITQTASSSDGVHFYYKHKPMRKYNTVILGAAGSGKTVYLSALYRKLSTPSEVGYFLDAPLPQQKRLRFAYNSLTAAWPPPTALADTDVFEFDITVKSPSGNQHAVTLCYCDMSGERLTEDTGDPEIEEATAGIFEIADILLGFIDGEKLCKQLSGGAADEMFWMHEMQALCEQMTKYDGKDKSIHFVVTKWDCFEACDDSLRKVRDALLAFPAFHNVVANCTGTVRLIPVSSVGREYAAILNGTAARSNGTLPTPLHVEVPFACVLPDMIHREMKAAQAALEQRARELNRPVLAKLEPWEIFGNWAGRFIHRFLEERNIDGGIFAWFAKFSSRSAQLKLLNAEQLQEQNQAEAQRLKTLVSDQETAAQFVMQSMATTESAFAMAYPSSKLN